MDFTYQTTFRKPNGIQNLLTFLLIVSYGGVLVQFLTFTTEIACILLVFLILFQSHTKVAFPNRFKRLYFLIVSLCLLSSVATGTSITKYISYFYRPIMAILILNAFSFDTELLKRSMAKALNYICILALFSFIIMPFVHDYLPLMVSSGGYPIKTLGFIVNADPSIPTHIDFVLPIYRNQGVFTEPGLMGIIANIYLYIQLFEYKYKIRKCWLPIAVIFSAMSTTGFLIFVIQLFVWGAKFVSSNKGYRIKSILLVVLAFLFLLPFVYSEVNEKFTRQGGTGREYDTFMSLEIAMHNPFIGIGPDQERYFLETRKYSVIVNDRIRSEERGNSNGLIAILCTMGVPIALLFLYGLYKQELFNSSRKVFFVVLCMAFFGEPNILNDFIFLILVSSVVKRKQQVALNKI